MTRSDPMTTGGVAEDESPPLEGLYRSHFGWLLRALRARFGADVAEDLAQETYLRAAGLRGAVRHPRALLMRIASNAAVDQARRRSLRAPVWQDAGESGESGEAASQAEAVLLKQVVLGLPPRLREVFLLSRFGGLTYPEIARRCGVSVKTVEARMTKALAICASKLRDEGRDRD